jgi:hypothetical protein
MNSKISFKIENSILACFITGERTIDVALEHWAQLLDKCKQENISRIQMNLAVKGRYSPFEAINNYQSIIEMLKQVKLKIALVDLNQISAPGTQVGCNMGASQGLNIRYFDSVQKARSWLLADYYDLSKIA